MKIQFQSSNSVLELVQGDITDLHGDAIVNAANSALQLGAGVAGAIRKKGGPQIQLECDEIGSTPTGTAAITSGGNLKAKFVIHAVGPTGDMPNRNELLVNAIESALFLTKKQNLQSIAIPAISTGIFGFPLAPAANIILATCLYFVKNLQETDTLKQIIICLFDSSTFDVFKTQLKQLRS